MIALIIEATMRKNYAGLARPGNKKRHAEADTAAVAPRRRQLIMQDLLISSLSLLALGAISAIAQANGYFSSAPRYWSDGWFPVDPVIQAWDPREQPVVPISWPDQNQQWKYPYAAIVEPMGIDVVNLMHREQRLLGLGILEGVPQAILT